MGKATMITEVRGNLLEADVDALVNTVDTVGIRAKGSRCRKTCGRR